MNTKMNNCVNRCIAINKNNKKCRAKTKDNELFCCSSHYPINKELFEEGCFICNEKISKSNEIIYFSCKHAFHKACYIEWLEFSTYDNPICLLCRIDVIKKKEIKIKTHKYNKTIYIDFLIDISTELNKIHNYYNPQILNHDNLKDKLIFYKSNIK